MIRSNLLLLLFLPVSCLRWTTSGLSTTCLSPCSFSSSSVLWLLISLTKEGKEDQDYHFVLFFKWFSAVKLSSNLLSAFFSPSQAGAGLRLAGLCLWTDPSGGVHVDLHVPFCVGGSLRSFPPVVTDPVRESQPPQVVQCPLCLHLPALPILCSGIPAYLHRSDQQSATCFPLHRHHGTGPWPDCLYLLKKTCSIYFWISVENVASVSLFVSPQVRLMMKAHSFIRENVPRVLTWAKDKTGMKIHPVIRAYYFSVDPMFSLFTVCS